MKTTEQFEAWWKSAYADSYDKSTVGYVLAKSIAWTAWQASRGAIEIEIPPAVDSSNVPMAGNAWNAYRDEAVKTIRAAGIKVKE